MKRILQKKNSYAIIAIGKKEVIKVQYKAKALSTGNTGGFLFMLLRCINLG